MLKNKYDVIVVGAGPAGSTAARFAAAGGISVLMLEKDRDVGYPVRCAEAVSHNVLQFIKPDRKWIATILKGFRFVAPNGKSFVLRPIGVGYVLERRLFDIELAKLAVNRGAEIITKTYVYDLLKDDTGKTIGVKALIKNNPVEIHSDIVVGADGVEARVGKWAGIDTASSIHDMDSCAQMTILGIDVEQDILEFYFGENVSPGGYAWVFPKGNKTASVGLGITVEKAKKKSARRYLQEFVERKYPNAAVLSEIAGGVPCAKTCNTLVKNNVMLVGDAGHQVNPVSGGGIESGMVGGMIAGQVAAEAIKQDDFSRLPEYEIRWQKRLGTQHEINYNIREAILSFSDETLNNIVEGALEIPQNERSFERILRKALWNKPSILIEITKLSVSSNTNFS
ncbi:MAG: NAD(P)/FAD-dependent oxidoreductase [Bacteroidota bacterium]|jgi:digeranylgeranylglycerophospholipid reductase